jgi:hypothetical protein
VAVRSAPANSGDQAPLQIPNLVVDPLASLRCWPVDIVLPAGATVIPALPAARWLEVLAAGDGLWLDDVVPGMCENPDLIEDALLDGDLAVDDVADLAVAAIEVASGRPWWAALRIVMATMASWDNVGADFVGIDAERVSLAAWLDAALPILINHMERSNARTFLMRLEMPPPELAEQVVEMPAEAFLAMM